MPYVNVSTHDLGLCAGSPEARNAGVGRLVHVYSIRTPFYQCGRKYTTEASTASMVVNKFTT